MEVCMIADKIKLLREASHLTQTELAKKLNITRSSVNAWEMGISVPSTTYLIELALLFHVSTDFLLGLEQNNTIDISTLSEREAILVYELVDYFTSQKKDVVD
jgi:transcriptional regulator with XRE-family HTH domain